MPFVLPPRYPCRVFAVCWALPKTSLYLWMNLGPTQLAVNEIIGLTSSLHSCELAICRHVITQQHPTCMRPHQQRPQCGWRASQGLSAAPSATTHLPQAPLALRAVRRCRCESCAARQARQLRDRGSMARPPGSGILNFDVAPTVHRMLPSDLVFWRVSCLIKLWCRKASFSGQGRRKFPPSS